MSVSSPPSTGSYHHQNLDGPDKPFVPPSPSTFITSPSPHQGPNPYIISTPSGDVQIDKDLCSIMLKPITSCGGRKRTNRSLDPGNKCITSKIFVDAIRSETNRKEKEEKREKARIAAEKKRREKLKKKRKKV